MEKRESPDFELKEEHIHEFRKINQKIWSRFNYNGLNDNPILQAKRELKILTEEEIEKFIIICE